MKQFRSTPHDALFKTFLTHPETARDFLQIHLPESLRMQCDLSTLQLESGSFIEDDLRALYSDVLWSIKMQSGSGYVYALIEHQSTPDKHMTFRLMRYAFAIMARHMDAGNEHLPLVIPMLFYHGRITPYPFSMCWLDSFAQPALAREIYGDNFPLIDVTSFTDDEIQQHRRIAILEFLQKNIRQRDLNDLVDQLVALLLPGYTTEHQFNVLMNYIARSGQLTSPGRFFRQLAQGMPEHKEQLMTLAEWFEERGRTKGRKQGREEGREEGERQATRKIALAMLRNGVDSALVSKTTGLSEQELSALAH